MNLNLKDSKTRNYFIAIIIVLVTLLVSIFAFVPIDKNHEESSRNWMSRVSDTALIHELSLPGTHDSGATHSIADVAGKCQDISIKTQLNIGVRFLDLRLQLINNEFIITHGPVKQNLYFSEVLQDLNDFIKENNKEFLVISIKEEASSINSSFNFNDALVRDLSRYQDIFCFDEKLPTRVEEARGKIYILRRFDGTIGISAHNEWKDDTTFESDYLYVQDNYNIQDIEEKKLDIMSTIHFSKLNNSKLVLNFTSCYLDPGFPPSYAGTSALEINRWFLDLIKEDKSTLGIMVIDFINEELSKSIYMRNLA